MEPIIETKRLALYPFTLSDLMLLEELHADPKVMRYLSADGALWTTAY